MVGGDIEMEGKGVGGRWRENRGWRGRGGG